MIGLVRIGLLLVLFACGASKPNGPTSPATSRPPERQARAGTFSLRAIATPNVGAIEGHLRDRDTNQPAAGATVIAMSPALVDQPRVVHSDDDGTYAVNDLPPGRYLVTVYFESLHEWHPIDVVAGFATLVDVDIVDPMGPARPFFP